MKTLAEKRKKYNAAQFVILKKLILQPQFGFSKSDGYYKRILKFMAQREYLTLINSEKHIYSLTGNGLDLIRRKHGMWYLAYLLDRIKVCNKRLEMYPFKAEISKKQKHEAEINILKNMHPRINKLLNEANNGV